MIGILFIHLCSITTQNFSCPPNMNCEMLQPMQNQFSSMLSSDFPRLTNMKCDQGRCMGYLLQDDCENCKKGNIKQKNNGQNVVTVTVNEIKTVTIDKTMDKTTDRKNNEECTKEKKKRKECEHENKEESTEFEEYKPKHKKTKKKQTNISDIISFCSQLGFDREKCKEYEKYESEKKDKNKEETVRSRELPNNKEETVRSREPRSREPTINKDITVTRVIEKTITIDKPITLYREMTTTVTKEKPIINYKVTTFTEISTKKENITITVTERGENRETIATKSSHSVPATVFPGDIKYNESDSSTESVDIKKKKKKKESISVSIITVTATPEKKSEKSTTCFDIPPVLSTITIGPATGSKTVSVSRAISKGCEVTKDGNQSKPKTICRFINVPKDLIKRSLEESLNKKQGINRKNGRRTVIRTVYKTEEPKDMNDMKEEVVTTTVYEK